jgi:hypothetical protein
VFTSTIFIDNNGNIGKTMTPLFINVSPRQFHSHFPYTINISGEIVPLPTAAE